MGSTLVSAMDPIFYRWHRHIDDIAAAFQEKQATWNASDWDSHFSHGVQLKNISIVPQTEFNDAVHAGSPTNVLHTRLEEREFILQNGSALTVTYLTHDHWTYEIKLENLHDRATPVTVRIFLIHKTLLSRPSNESRRFWIEMDTFIVDAPPGSSTVSRNSRQASVAKKRTDGFAEISPSLLTEIDNIPPVENWCDCGLPYHLLLPSGDPAPAEPNFQMLVLLTEGADLANLENKCGSFRFCGATGSIRSGKRHPDRQPMGFPFHRPEALETLQLRAPNSPFFLVNLTIKHITVPSSPAFPASSSSLP